MAIRSFRVCFHAERRIHKIDQWRIPLPFGVPLRGLGYAAGALLAVLVLGGMPVAGDLLGAMHPALRLVILPLGIAYALTRWEIDGRPASATARSWLRLHTQPTRIAAFRRVPSPGRVVLGAVTLAPDERSARLRRGIVAGPARVLVRYPFRASQDQRTLRLEPQPGPPQWRGKQIDVPAGQRIVIG